MPTHRAPRRAPRVPEARCRRAPAGVGARALPACAAALTLLMAGSGVAPASAAAAPPAGPTTVAAAPASVPADLDPGTVRRLDTAIAAVMEKADVPGVNIGLRIPGRGEYVKAFGVADVKTGVPMKTDMYSRIGSVTKTFTVTGVLQLVDRGLVGLDDPISKYVAGVPGGEHVTVRQLAGMRSGLFNYTDDEKFLAELRADPHRAFTPREVLTYAFAHPPNFAPGAKWQYSNTNTVLLGLLVEKVSGQPLAGYLREHVAAPLKLNSTALPSGSAFPEPHAHGYTTFSPGGKVVDATDWNPSWGWAAGAMTSDLEDLGAWVPALLDGRLLKPATQAQRLCTEPTGFPGVSYGLGIAEFNGWVGHNGDLPGYETIAVGLPATGATLVILINSDTDRGGSLSSQVANAVTKIVTPAHVWALPPAAKTGETKP
ncbi:serine hydrolase domain-containing protein [Streptomyces sp. NPDC087917]|uniref:serine hydrolase domain-containing protein n=1 Tax=Streptomyces sp. NPDC087917 TaxID=3155060 RepID=UPI00341D0F9C